jgi:hypothetical protein
MFKRLGRLLRLAPAFVAVSSATPTHGAPTSQHGYAVRTIDAQGAPLAGVVVKLSVSSRYTPPLSTSCTTDDQGRCPVVRYEVHANPNIRDYLAHSSTANAQGSKPGYYPASGSAEKAEGTRLSKTPGAIAAPPPADPGEITLRMTCPTDYMEDSLVDSASLTELRERVTRFLDMVNSQGSLGDDDLVFKSIGPSNVYGKPHLRLMIRGTDIHTGPNLTATDIALRLFEGSARRLLATLPGTLQASPAYPKSRPSFEPGAVVTRNELRLLVSETAVRQLKEKAITAQALLDASIVQVNGQSVELRLP